MRPGAILSFLLFVKLSGAERDFSDIGKVPQDVSKVILPATCPKFGRVTNVMYTFEPSSGEDEQDLVKISTFPANLVTATRGKDNELQLELNKKVAYDANEGGVRIYFPPSQLKYVSVHADARAQILDGFTGINTLRVSSDATLFATMTTLNNSTDSDKLSIKVQSDGVATVISNKEVKDLEVSSDGKLTIEAPNADHVSVQSDAVLNMKGNVNYARVASDAKLRLDGDLVSGKIKSDARITVYGKVTGNVDVKSDAILYVGEEISDTASVEASSDAKVYAPSCDKVSTKSDAKCILKDDVDGTVNVMVEEQPFTLTGTHRCWGSGVCSSFKRWFCTVLVLAILVTIVFILYKRSRHHNHEQSNYGAQQDHNKVQVAEAYEVDDLKLNENKNKKVAVARQVDPYTNKVNSVV